MKTCTQELYDRSCDSLFGRCWRVTHWCWGTWELTYLPDDEREALDVCAEVPW